MARKILVCFAPKRGATAEISKRIAEVIRKSELPVECKPIDQVTSLLPHTGVVLGSAVYNGRWLKEASRFIIKNRNILADIPFWVFSSGPTGDVDIEEWFKEQNHSVKLKKALEVTRPKSIRVFHGAFNPKNLNYYHKWRANQASVNEGDFRNWESIEIWADEIAASYKSLKSV